jgi:glycosyltransferase involved in cell wall biosynthesis
MKISYAIPVCNEYVEIQRLVSFLLQNKRSVDEIVVLFDSTNGSDEVDEYLKSVEDIIVQPYKFDGDFAKMKNHLNSMCNGDYIFQIDADEMISEYLIDIIPEIITLNRNVDLFKIARVNTVEGLTEEHIRKWGWRVDEKNKVNWPDYQTRIHRNEEKIRWEGKVHEKIVGCDVISHLPFSEDWALQHHKKIERQERQNQYYDTL